MHFRALVSCVRRETPKQFLHMNQQLRTAQYRQFDKQSRLVPNNQRFSGRSTGVSCVDCSRIGRTYMCYERRPQLGQKLTRSAVRMMTLTMCSRQICRLIF